jgi:hypothetical protein
MRNRRRADLTVPQFRTLAFIHRKEAPHLQGRRPPGLKLPLYPDGSAFHKGLLQREEQSPVASREVGCHWGRA